MIKYDALRVLTLLAAISIGTFSGRGEDDNPLGRIGVSYRAAFNISAEFSGLGGFAPTGNPGGAGRIEGLPGTIIRSYDDGFIGIDISGNANERTTFWGYDDSTAQVVGDAVQMHSSSSPASGRSKTENDPLHGFEINYLHPLLGSKRWHLGFEGALNWTDIKLKSRGTFAGNVSVLTHNFSLDGVLPPLAPPAYVGPVDGPGAPQLSDEAIVVGDTQQNSAATTSGIRKIEGDFYGCRLGPYTEFRLRDRFSLTFGGGLSVGVVDSRFSYNDTTTISGVGSQNHSGNDSSSAWTYGAYLRGQASVYFDDGVAFFGGVECNNMRRFDQTAGMARVSVDMGSVIYAFAGFSWSF